MKTKRKCLKAKKTYNTIKKREKSVIKQLMEVYK